MADKKEKGMTIQELVTRSNIDRALIPVWDKLRLEAFEKAKQVFADRSGVNIDHPPYEEMVFGPVSFATEIFKRARRLASWLSPMRSTKIRPDELNRIIDLHIDLINYLTWNYAMLIMASGYQGHLNSDDAPDYIGKDKNEDQDVEK